MFRVISAATALAVLAGCGGPSGLDLELPNISRVKTEPLAEGTITLKDEEYVLKRNRLLNGPNAGGEAWAIVVDGRTVGCPSPDEEGCLLALRAAEAGARDEGGMY